MATTERDNAAVTGTGQPNAAAPGNQNAHRMLASHAATVSNTQPSPPSDVKQAAEASDAAAVDPLQCAHVELQKELLPASLLRFDQEWAALVSNPLF